MDKAALISALQAELRRHDHHHYVESPPSIAEGGGGVVTVGCATCKRRAHTSKEFIEHLAMEVIPRAVEEAFKAQGESSG